MQSSQRRDGPVLAGAALAGVLEVVRGALEREEILSPPGAAVGDPRERLWAMAGEFEADMPSRRTALMKFLCWLCFRQGVNDLETLEAVAERVAQSRVPYGYFRPGSKALEALVGSVAVQRAERERAAREAEDQKLGIGRKP